MSPRHRLLSLVALIAIATISLGQRVVRPYYGYGQPYRYGYGYGTNSTGSTYRGYADYIRAQGEAAESTARAKSEFERGKSQELDNKLRSTEVFYQMRRVRQQYMDEKRSRYPKPTAEQFAERAKAGLPAPLSDNQLNAATGMIEWPLSLQTDDFEQERKQLDHLFRQRAEVTGAIGGNEYMTILDLIDRMRDQLRTKIRILPTGDYITAMKFLESLALEARSPTT